MGTLPITLEKDMIDEETSMTPPFSRLVLYICLRSCASLNSYFVATKAHNFVSNTAYIDTGLQNLPSRSDMSISQSIIYTFPNTKRMSLPRYQTLVFSPMSEIRVRRDDCKSLCSTWQLDSKMKRSFAVYSSIPPEPSNLSGGLPGGLPGSWKGWLLGMVVTVLIPLLTNKWGALLKWTRKNEEQIESTVQTVEDIVEAVEDVAEKVEKFTEGIIDDLPEGKFKTVLGRIEHVAEEVAKDAKQIDNVIDKFQEVEDKVHTYIEEKQSNKAAEKDKNDGKHEDK